MDTSPGRCSLRLVCLHPGYCLSCAFLSLHHLEICVTQLEKAFLELVQIDVAFPEHARLLFLPLS